MPASVFDKIIQDREIKNEKRVAYIRFALGIMVIPEMLSYFNFMTFDRLITLPTLLNSMYLFLYSLLVLIIAARSKYLKYLKFFVIFFDYSYIVFTFLFDPSITAIKTSIVWLSFTASIVFFLINLLRYSRQGTIFAGLLSIIVYLGVCFHFSVLPEEIINVGVPLILIIFIGYSITTANKKMMIEANTKKMMERYLPPQLVGELFKQNVVLKPGGTTQEATVLFSDIRSFTSISESLSAEEVVSVLNKYLSEMTDIIFRNQGTIDKFIGDAIMTIFGAPVQHSDDAQRAVLTAVEMKNALNDFNRNNVIYDKPLEIGIGIHTGEVIAGNIGSDKRLDYTVIGDNVNLSSRIEGLTNYYGCSILISEYTYEKLSRDFTENSICIREIDNVIVKGKSKAVKILEVMDFKNEEEWEQVMKIKKSFEEGLELYRQQKFKEAIPCFKQLIGDGPSKIYINRCRKYLKTPPDSSWDGTFFMVTK